jgi:hypothetical protein
MIKVTVNGPYIGVDAIDVLSMDDLDPLFKAFENAARAGRFVVLTDTTRMKTAPRAVMSGFVDGLKRVPNLSGNWLGDAVVISSPAVRFVLSTLLMVAPMPTEVKAFEFRSPAQQWCAGILQKAGLVTPPELRKAV